MFIVQYSGNMGLWNDMESFGKSVNSNLEGVHYVFIGGGMREQELHQSISEENPPNALFLPFQPMEKICIVLTGCHASLVSLREGLEGMAVPSKIYGILAAGVPVLALVPQKSEIAYIVEEEQCGMVIDPGDVEGLDQAIVKLKSDEVLRNEMARNSRNAFLKKYTIEIIGERYLQLLRDLV
jgi:glycosyltransferase involved in cell wall biosynthesis